MSSLVLFLHLLSPAQTPAQPLSQGLEKLQGTWKLVSLKSQSGFREFTASPPRWVFKGNQVFYGGEAFATVVLDDSADPKVIDLVFLSPKGTCEGIFKTSKNSLTLCINRSTEGIRERPLRFSVEEQSQWRLMEFVRDETGPAGGTEGLAGYIGLVLRMDPQTGQILVEDTLEGSPARKAGLRKGEVILKVGDLEANDLSRVVGVIRRAKPGAVIPIQILREKKKVEVSVKTGVLPINLLF